jgi:galactokinase
MMDKKTIGENFKKTYGREAQSVYFSPGRVNVIGEHTDHNGGYVSRALSALELTRRFHCATTGKLI